ncbi:Peptidase family M28 [compost metagenome]
MRTIWDSAKSLGFASHFPPREGPAVNDDHLPFLEKGVPFVDLIDFDYPYWHTSGDTPERCSPRSLEIVGNVVLGAVRALDR